MPEECCRICHDPAGIPSKIGAQYVEVLISFAALWSAPSTVWLGMSHSRTDVLYSTDTGQFLLDVSSCLYASLQC